MTSLPEAAPTDQLRELLAVIHSSVALLQRRGGHDAGTTRHLDRIREHLDRCCEVLGRMEPLDPRA
jgi:hypothetical protein